MFPRWKKRSAAVADSGARLCLPVDPAPSGTDAENEASGLEDSLEPINAADLDGSPTGSYLFLLVAAADRVENVQTTADQVSIALLDAAWP